MKKWDLNVQSSLLSQICLTTILLEAGISVRRFNIKIYTWFSHGNHQFSWFFNLEGYFSNFSSFQYDLGIFRNKENKMHDTQLHIHLFQKSKNKWTMPSSFVTNGKNHTVDDGKWKYHLWVFDDGLRKNTKKGSCAVCKYLFYAQTPLHYAVCRHA